MSEVNSRCSEISRRCEISCLCLLEIQIRELHEIRSNEYIEFSLRLEIHVAHEDRRDIAIFLCASTLRKYIC